MIVRTGRIGGVALVGAAILIGGAWIGAVVFAEQAPCGLTYDSFGKGFMEQYCVRCHTSAKASKFARSGAPLGADFDQIDAILKDKGEILKYTVEKKTMPPGDPKPAADERKKLKTWLECEAR